MHTQMCACAHTCMHIHIHSPPHTHTHTHTHTAALHSMPFFLNLVQGAFEDKHDMQPAEGGENEMWKISVINLFDLWIFTVVVCVCVFV